MSEGIITVHHDFPIEHIEMLKDVWNKSQAEEGKVNVNSLTSVRNSKVQWLHQSNYPSLALSVSLLIKDCNKRKWGYHIDSMQPMQLSRYDSNDAHYDWHVDTMWWKSEYAYQRKLTLIVQLTDAEEYRGGHLEFDKSHGPLWDVGSHVHTRERGTVIIFPSWLRHRVTPVTDGARMSLVAWAEGPAFR